MATIHHPVLSRSITGRLAGLRAPAATLGLALVVSLGLPGAPGHADPQQRVGDAQAQVDALTQQADIAVEAFDRAQVALDEARARAADAQAEVAAAQAAVAQQRKAIGVFAAAAYEAGGRDQFLSLIATRNPQVFLDQASSLDKLAQQRSVALATMRATAHRLAGAQAAAAAQLAAADRAAATLDAQRRHVQALLAAQDAVLSGLQATQRAAIEAGRQAEVVAATERASRARAAAPVAAPTDAGASAPAPVSGGASNKGQIALQAAYSQTGKPYVYGAAGPNAYDCSGLVMWAFARAGVSLPHSAAGQYGYGTHIPVSQLQPGDIVFFSEGGGIGHDGIYAGNGTMVDANHSGGSVGVRPLYSGLIGGTRI